MAPKRLSVKIPDDTKIGQYLIRTQDKTGDSYLKILNQITPDEDILLNMWCEFYEKVLFHSPNHGTPEQMESLAVMFNLGIINHEPIEKNLMNDLISKFNGVK